MKTSYDRKKRTFEVKESDVYKNIFELYATDTSSVHYITGSAEEVSQMYARWLKNTIEAMSKNNCTKIIMSATWIE